MDHWTSHLTWRVGILLTAAGILACLLVGLAGTIGLGSDELGPKKDVLFGIGALMIISGAVIVEARVGTPGPRE